MLFHEILSQERKARGLSQEELAARIQVSRQAVSKWETGDAMPDLNRLLALADALDISLDTLCGRDAHGAETGTPAPPETPSRVSGGNRRRWPAVCALCALLAVCLLAGGLWWNWSQRNVVPSETATAESSLPDTFTVSGVTFSGKPDALVAYSFTPSAAGEGYTYQITFTDDDGSSYTFDAPYIGGVCSGTASPGGWGTYASVTVSVSDGVNTRNIAIARNLEVSDGHISWTPLD